MPFFFWLFPPSTTSAPVHRRPSVNLTVPGATTATWALGGARHSARVFSAEASMARSLVNMAFKGITESYGPLRPSMASSRIFGRQGVAAYSSVSGGSDSHEDFQSTSKVAGSNVTLKDIVEQDVNENPVMIYMKGIPDAPACGFSSLAVRVLKVYGVPINSRNILEDLELKNSVKAFSHWPTFPQIFIKGEFIGGSDIILNMHQSGELKEKLKGIAETVQEK